MAARTTVVTLLSALVVPVLAVACSVQDDGTAATDPGGAGGKADGFGDACPADVRLNSAQGSARRCINDANGQFVSTACCVDVCDGAGWREQSNGQRCAWLDEPGMEGATKGQFAPQLCCDLNDSMACGRASVRGSDGACVDSADPDRLVGDVCCDAQPVECSPVVARELRDCVHEVRFDAEDDPELALPTPLQALQQCATEGDLTGAMLDRICQFQPESLVCDATFEDFQLSHVAACHEALTPEFDCALGLTFRDIVAPQPTLAIHTERTLSSSDIGALTDDMAAQIQAAHTLHSFAEQTASLTEIFDDVDQGVINYVEFWDGSNAQAYAAIEFGLGDNGFGAVFEAGTATIAVEIQDSDLIAPQSGGGFTCGPTIGPRWAQCSGNDDCAEGLSCQGLADLPGVGRVGKCVQGDLGGDSGRLDGDCGPDSDACPFESGLVCSGLGATPADDAVGFCRSIWATTLLRDDAITSIEDNGTTDRTVHANGLASVPEDAILELGIEHEDFSQIRIEMDDAGGEDFVVIFDGNDANDLASLPATSGFVTLVRNVPHSGDDEVNGAWTLRVIDRAAGAEGAIIDWSLRLSSRFD